MNSVNSTPPPAVPAATPTVGAVLGGVITMAVTPYVAAIPGAETAISMLIPGFFAWAAHKLHASFLSAPL